MIPACEPVAFIQHCDMLEQEQRSGCAPVTKVPHACGHRDFIRHERFTSIPTALITNFPAERFTKQTQQASRTRIACIAR